MPIQGAKAIALTRQYDNPIFLLVQKLRERIGWQKAVVALANKNARIAALKTTHINQLSESTNCITYIM